MRMRKEILIILPWIFGFWTAAQVKREQANTSVSTYSNASLGFRYVPPVGMRDKTERLIREIQEYAQSIHSSDTLTGLLSMSSGPDDKLPTWSSVTIETYPRKVLQSLDDVQAEVQMSGWVAHSQNSPVPPRLVVVSGQSFAVSLFGFQDGNLRKGAVVWTTIRHGHLLAFAFAANSPAELEKLAESIKSLEFF
jgi:hypothetical protein